MASIEPQLWVGSPAQAVRFYVEALGAEVLLQSGAGEDVVVRLDVDGARFWVARADATLRRRSPEPSTGATGRVLLVVDDPSRVVASLAAAGAVVTADVDEEHGWLAGRVVDPFGHEWEIGRHLGD